MEFLIAFLTFCEARCSTCTNKTINIPCLLHIQRSLKPVVHFVPKTDKYSPSITYSTLKNTNIQLKYTIFLTDKLDHLFTQLLFNILKHSLIVTSAHNLS